MKECKFTPDIIGFNYNNTGLPGLPNMFYTDKSREVETTLVEDRCQAWGQQKEAQKTKFESQIMKERDKECVFRPRTNQAPCGP